MAVPRLYKKQLLHLISCGRYRELQANNFEPSLRSIESLNVHLKGASSLAGQPLSNTGE